MMDRALLDTDIFSEIIKAKNSVVLQNADAHRQEFGHLVVSVLTIAEVVKGLQKRGMEQRIVGLLSLLGYEEVIPLNLDAAVVAGRIYAALEKAHSNIKCDSASLSVLSSSDIH